jgi:adenylosuccinate lyase
MLKLIEKGLSREESYKLVQTNAMKAWNSDNGNFKEYLSKDPSVTKHLRQEEIASCFDPNEYLKNINVVFDRIGV